MVTESRDAGELSSQEEQTDLNLRPQMKVLPLRLWLLPSALHKGGAQSILLRTANKDSLDNARTEQEEEAEQTRQGAEEGFRTEAGGNGGLYGAHLYMLQGKTKAPG